MSNLQLLNNVDHQDTRVITERGAAWGDDVMYAMTFPNEFRAIQACYPILFHEDDKGETYPVALFGFQAGENLFLDDAGWHADYVPAMIRKEPFLIGFQESTDGGGPDTVRVLSINAESPRVSTTDGEALFQPLGGRTPFLDDMADLLENIYLGVEHGQRFVTELRAHDLLETVTFDIQLDDGSRNQLLGFQTINEEKLQALPADVLERFNRDGFLMPLFMVLASHGNVRRLVDRKNGRPG